MKLFTKYLILLFSLFLLKGCDNPAPTELVQEDPLEVEVITKDTDDEIHSSGFDSTGVIYDPGRASRGFANVVTVTGMKTRYRNATVSTSYAQAIFFDTDSPVLSPDNRLIGFKTQLLGNVDFNGKRARHVQMRIRFKRGNGDQADSLLGFKHVLHHTPLNQRDDFNFEYGSFVNFNFDPFAGNSANFNIPTPTEINGSVQIEGNRSNFKGQINWNAEHADNFEIIIGVSKRNERIVFPLFRLKTRDDGSLEIPSDILNQIPFDRYGRLVFSLVRKIEFNFKNDDNTLYILSQSIHNLVLDIL